SIGDDSQGASLTFRGYHGKWDSSDQVARSAVDDGIVDLFGSLDDTTGGDSQRYSLQGEWHRSDASSATRIEAYAFYYDLDLFSNFTYFLTDPQRGDQFEQTDRRWVGGVDARHTFYGTWWGKDVENSFGLQARNDAIENGLYQTQARRRVDKINAADGSILPATTRADDILQTSGGLYYENKIRWAEKFRSVAGVRGDLYRFDVDSIRAENSGERSDGIASPKLSLIAGPWAKTEFYLQGGLGFHSNDGRGTVTRVDPISGSSVDADGNPIRRADPLVQTRGAEVGVRTLAVDGLQSTLSVWWLDIDSELLFVGDAGLTEASRPSRRYGVEWANFYTLAKDLTLDVDASFSRAEFRDDDPAGDKIPGSIESVVAAGISYHPAKGVFGSLRLRYFGPRPLIEDDTFRSGETILLGAQIGYRFNRTWTLTADVFNVLDRRDDDITYAYESRVRPDGAAVTQVHFHPVEPIQARFALTARF
ncbi:MAG: TonB-dependent receptor, partial [Verrucomicrobiales bacterium]|nr:TonB-dependent receptor [Verrucomicrobiales bacterium]